LQAREAGNVALLGFSFPDDRQTSILDLIDNTAESYLLKMPHYKVIERERIDGILLEQELSLSDLRDTNKAIKAGKSLSAHYVLTGTVIEMTKSVVIFCRVINVETAVIESIGQVIVPRTEEVNALL
jgi:TolB-like protein